MLVELRRAKDLVAAQLKSGRSRPRAGRRRGAVMTTVAEIEGLGAAGRLLFAHRATRSACGKEAGYTSPASWMANLTGTGLREAAGLKSSAALRQLPETEEALRKGELSSSQLHLMAEAATSAPSAEGDLLDPATTGTRRDLKDKAAPCARRPDRPREKRSGPRRGTPR